MSRAGAPPEPCCASSVRIQIGSAGPCSSRLSSFPVDDRPAGRHRRVCGRAADGEQEQDEREGESPHAAHPLSVRAVVEVGCEGADAAVREAEGRVLDPELLGNDLLAGSVVAGDPARHRLVPGIGARDADADCILDAEPAAARRVVDLDLRRLDAEQVARLPRPGEVVDLASGDASGPDFFERPVLFGRPSVVQVEDPAPGRAFLVVAVASRQRDSDAGKVGLIRVAVDDLPVQRAQADRRASTGLPACR